MYNYIIIHVHVHVSYRNFCIKHVSTFAASYDIHVQLTARNRWRGEKVGKEGGKWGGRDSERKLRSGRIN